MEPDIAGAADNQNSKVGTQNSVPDSQNAANGAPTPAVGTAENQNPQFAIQNSSALVRRGLLLEYVTLGWNALEALVAVVAGLAAGSVALLGFGLDSIIEMTSSAALLWRLRATGDHERRERIALRIVGVSFLALTVYVTAEAVQSLLLQEWPYESLAGIAIAAASLIVMPLLARAKRRVAAGLNSGAMHADSRQTDICAYLSAILLGGLLLNAVLGWWWADPVAALIMAPLIANEGAEAVLGRTCGCHEIPAATTACERDAKTAPSRADLTARPE